ncbi:MAG: DNA methyltransferase [Methylotenera sp.]
MNAVEIEQAISDLAEQPFDAVNFPYAFLEAFGNKETTIKRLKSSNENKSDVENGVLQRNNIHIAVCSAGATSATLDKLRASPATEKAKAKFILATDGVDFEAEDLNTGETVACAYADFPNHFGFFLALAGISTVKQIRESSFDIRATSRLNRLYVELLRTNPEWGTAERRHDMNHFMARLIFCFFAEDTDIFNGNDLFTATIEQMSAKDASDTHEVISEVFRAMNTKIIDRATSNIKRWADGFPYVNGGLFSDSTETPRFTKIARSYLLHVGKLDWTKINPDIFGSMIQAVADDEERGALGMHYTSVPNILKVLNPLFLDDLRAELEVAGDNPRKLVNLRKRMAHIRVFDPACGSGNFLVIAYKQMREIEAEINKRRSENHLKSEISIKNFRGIELRDFSAEIARLALIIAEYQCDVTYIGQKEALQAFLPLDSQNWITCGNALQLDWLTICPPTGTGVKLVSDDLFNTPLDQAEIDFENEGGETYICGNPPYLGSKWQTEEQKQDLKSVFEQWSSGWKSLDYVSGWFLKAAIYGTRTNSATAFVTTNSICQGLQVPILWPVIFSIKCQIFFAHTSFTWSNLASNNAGVTVAIVGITSNVIKNAHLYSMDKIGNTVLKSCVFINAYLVPSSNIIVKQERKPISELSPMLFGNMPRDDGNFILTTEQKSEAIKQYPELAKFIKSYIGSEEMTHGKSRWCFWIEDKDKQYALNHPLLSKVLNGVKEFRLKSNAQSTVQFAEKPHRFVQIAGVAKKHTIAVAKVSTEKRQYLPAEIYDDKVIVSDLLFALYDAPIWNFAIVVSQIHRIWIGTICGKMRIHYRYSNTLGWNTFPLPKLTEKNKFDLSQSAKNILLARQKHFPKPITELYEPEEMPEDLLHAHEMNDEILERIYIGRRFKNDTERMEVLFNLYSKKLG